MKSNRNRRPNGTARRLRRMEDQLEVILCDLNRLHARMNWIQEQIKSRNDLEMDLAVNRLRLSAKTLKELADTELQAVKERYGKSGI